MEIIIAHCERSAIVLHLFNHWRNFAANSAYIHFVRSSESSLLFPFRPNPPILSLVSTLRRPFVPFPRDTRCCPEIISSLTRIWNKTPGAKNFGHVTESAIKLLQKWWCVSRPICIPYYVFFFCIWKESWIWVKLCKDIIHWGIS